MKDRCEKTRVNSLQAEIGNRAPNQEKMAAMRKWRMDAGTDPFRLLVRNPGEGIKARQEGPEIHPVIFKQGWSAATERMARGSFVKLAFPHRRKTPKKRSRSVSAEQSSKLLGQKGHHYKEVTHDTIIGHFE